MRARIILKTLLLRPNIDFRIHAPKIRTAHNMKHTPLDKSTLRVLKLSAKRKNSKKRVFLILARKQHLGPKRNMTQKQTHQFPIFALVLETCSSVKRGAAVRDQLHIQTSLHQRLSPSTLLQSALVSFAAKCSLLLPRRQFLVELSSAPSSSCFFFFLD